MKKANSSKSCRLGRYVRPWCPVLLLALLGTFGQGMLAQQSPPHSAGWVVIGVKEYRALRARAYPEQMEPDLPPIDATLSRVEYDLRVTGELATGEATLTIDVSKKVGCALAFPPVCWSAKRA